MTTKCSNSKTAPAANDSKDLTESLEASFGGSALSQDICERCSRNFSENLTKPKQTNGSSSISCSSPIQWSSSSRGSLGTQERREALAIAQALRAAGSDTEYGFDAIYRAFDEGYASSESTDNDADDEVSSGRNDADDDGDEEE
jgi:hypothetical protein